MKDDVFDKLKGEKKDYPRIYRHLENPVGRGLLSVDSDTKRYTQTFLAKLVLEGLK